MSRAAEKTTKLDKKGIAKALYLNGEYTQEEIAEKVGVTRKTVNTWIKADSWEESKPYHYNHRHYWAIQSTNSRN